MDHMGRNRLHVAAAEGNLQKVKRFVEEGEYDINAMTIGVRSTRYEQAGGCTPLFFATQGCTTGHIKVVKYLLSKGANSDAQNDDGITPLHNAIKYRGVDMVKCLVEQGGASVNIANNRGNTPLHHAASRHVNIVSYLIEKGANVGVTNQDGKTALDCAILSEESQSILVLSSAGSNMSDETLFKLKNEPIGSHRKGLNLLQLKLENKIIGRSQQSLIEKIVGIKNSELIYEKALGLLKILGDLMALENGIAEEVNEAWLANQEFLSKGLIQAIPSIQEDTDIVKLSQLYQALDEKENVKNLLDDISPGFSEQLETDLELLGDIDDN